ncbi:MAG TPA: LacI family DNA-binding transcriptional regulator [Thermoanaerobaculia bacterium]|nr:LacI family DNA-binding transcriptional regulator [Thermoanaerobaculia bacterium]
MPVRMKDIAHNLGLSQTTVSHVLRGREAEFRIGAETANRVRAAARRLRYHPSALARNLKHHRSYTLALAVDDLTNPFWAGLAVAAQQEAEQHGYMLVVNQTAESLAKERHLLEMLRQKRVDGLILSAAHLRPVDLAALREESRPLVLVDRTIDGLDFPHVVTDSIAGVRLGVDHLVAKGHRRIAFLGGPRYMSTFRDRLAGYRRAMAAHRLRPGPHIVAQAAPGPAQRAARRLFEQGGTKPTAVIAANIWLTIGALRGTPDQVEIVGFDDIYLADMLRRPVTTIAQPVEELGRQAVRLLLETVGKPATNHKVVLAPQLIVR